MFIYTKAINTVHSLIMKYKRYPDIVAQLSVFLDYWMTERNNMLQATPYITDQEYINLPIY